MAPNFAHITKTETSEGVGYLMTDLEKKLKLAADSSSFCEFQDKLGQLLRQNFELNEEFLQNVAGGVKTDEEMEK